MGRKEFAGVKIVATRSEAETAESSGISRRAPFLLPGKGPRLVVLRELLRRGPDKNRAGMLSIPEIR